MSDNPFSPPSSLVGSKDRYQDFGDFQLSGKYLICGSELMLPSYCVITGEDEPIEYVEDVLVYVSPGQYALRLIALPLVILFPPVILLRRVLFRPEPRDCCHVSYCVARRIVARGRWLLWVGSILVIWSFMWVIRDLDLVPRQGMSVLIGPVMPLLTAIMLAVVVRASPKPLRLRKLKEGCFWIYGFKEPFVRRLEEGED